MGKKAKLFSEVGKQTEMFEHFPRADPDYGDGVARGVGLA